MSWQLFRPLEVRHSICNEYGYRIYGYVADNTTHNIVSHCNHSSNQHIVTPWGWQYFLSQAWGDAIVA